MCPEAHSAGPTPLFQLQNALRVTKVMQRPQGHLPLRDAFRPPSSCRDCFTDLALILNCDSVLMEKHCPGGLSQLLDP